jgi:release factor glutamine methyltransferase
VTVHLDLAGTVARLRAAGCVFAEDEARLLHDAATSAHDLDAVVARRTAGEPLELILGWAQFCGLRIAVAPGVFVPRRRTEFLVDKAIRLAGAGDVVLDLCCGTGALGAAVIASVPVELYAVDLDPAAVQCARRNLPEARIYEGDLYEPLPASLRGRVALLLANAPYVPTDAIAMMPAEARDYEHRVALDGGSDGLDVQRRLIAGAPPWLAPEGHLLVETSTAQAEQTLALLQAGGFDARIASDEERGSTVAIARARPRTAP